MNKTFKISSLIAVSMLAIGVNLAQAEDSSSGCGLGWQVSQRQSLVSSSIRSTTNAILPNTYSMTTGSSGCAKHTIVKNDEAAVYFASNNVHSLVAEMAQGQGEYLDGFSAALGCNGSARAQFGAFVQSHYSDIRANSAQGDGVSLYRAVRTQIQASPELSGACVPSATI